MTALKTMVTFNGTITITITHKNSLCKYVVVSDIFLEKRELYTTALGTTVVFNGTITTTVTHKNILFKYVVGNNIFL